MRLIDADALISDLEYDIKMDQDSLDYEDLSDVNRKNIQTDKDIKQNAIDILENAPTVDAVPVVHGRWGSVGDFYHVCSCCGKEIFGYFGKEGVAFYMRYCSNCGARMDEVTE